MPLATQAGPGGDALGGDVARVDLRLDPAYAEVGEGVVDQEAGGAGGVALAAMSGVQPTRRAIAVSPVGPELEPPPTRGAVHVDRRT